MIELPLAMVILEDAVAPFPMERLPLGECLGLTLTEAIISGIDSPPFDKALMDGYAVHAADVAMGSARLMVIERITAGQVPQREVTAGTAIQIMTGAPLPVGADAVVKIEETTLTGDVVEIRSAALVSEQNLIRRGAALRVGETVLEPGTKLTPAQIGVLAELGCARVPVRRAPRIAVLATGDELVPVDQTPGPGQIRNTNEPMLAAQIAACGATVVPLGIARDVREDLAAKIQLGLEYDILVLSGGVSAGKLDLVPSELAAAGVQEVFHKVNMKPGKPVYFGKRGKPGQAGGCAVFGLPGNPVSSMVCFELFVRTAIRRLMGVTHCWPKEQQAVLTEAFRHRSDRPTYHPAELRWDERLEVRILPWQGSSDLRSTVAANGMAILPVGERMFRPGETIEVVSW
jgi:molybdopterin molybdotransferase